MAKTGMEGTQEMEVWYDVRGPDGVHYDKTSIKVPIDTKIGNFGARVARDYSALSVPNGGGTVFPSAEGNLKALPLTNPLGVYDGEIGTEKAPFHIRLKQEPASGVASAISLQETTNNNRDSYLRYTKSTHTILYHPPSAAHAQSLGLLEEKKQSRSFVTIERSPYHSPKLSKALENTNVFVDQGIEINAFQGLVPKLEREMLKSAVWDAQSKFTVQENNMGEMVFQQLVYSPLARVFMAAARGCGTTRYAADQDVRSSLSVSYRKQNTGQYIEGKLTMQPDVAVTLTARRCDAFGMMEIKPLSNSLSEDYRIDYDKCVLMTAATAIVLSKTCVTKDADMDKIALPFVIARGHLCALYVMRIGKSGPFVQFVQVTEYAIEVSINCQHSPSNIRSRLMVALGVLLNDFLEFFDEAKELEYVKAFPTPVRDGIPSVFTKKNKRDRDNADDAEEGSKSSKIDRRGGQPKADTEEAAAHAAACGSLFRQVEYPWERTMRFTDSDVVMEEQTNSPFYFRAHYVEEDNKRVFLKVWDSSEVETGDVEAEWNLQWAAHKAGVPVATPIFEEVLRSTTKADESEYLVLAMEFVEFDAIEGALDYMMFALALIKTVESLHSCAGMLHCDLKPQNVRWSKGVVKLIDFERAQFLSVPSCHRGTEGYEAPEILAGYNNTPSTDAYAVGTVILRCMEDSFATKEVENTFCAELKRIAQNLASQNPSTRWSLKQASEALESFIDDKVEGTKPGENAPVATAAETKESPPMKIAKVDAGYQSLLYAN